MDAPGGRFVHGRARCNGEGGRQYHAIVWMTPISDSEWECPVPGCGAAVLLVRPMMTMPTPATDCPGCDECDLGKANAAYRKMLDEDIAFLEGVARG